MRFGLIAAFALLITGCASAGMGSGSYVDPDYNFSRVRSVYVKTPIRIALRGSSGIGNRELEQTVEDELRLYVQRERGWSWASRVDDADLVIGFELTHWEEETSGSRVGGSIELTRPGSDEVVLRNRTVYPNQFGTPSPGRPRDLLPALYRALLEPAKGN